MSGRSIGCKHYMDNHSKFLSDYDKMIFPFINLIVVCTFKVSRLNGHNKHDKHRSGHGYESSSMMSSDIESTSFFDSDDTTSRYSSVTSNIYSF